MVSEVGYVETCLKIVMSGQSGYSNNPEFDSSAKLEELMSCLLAHMRFLQEDFCGLLVGSNFGPKTQQIFRSLQKHTSAFPPCVLDTLKSAATLASIPEESNRKRGGTGNKFQPQYRGRFQNYSRFRSRGRGNPQQEYPGFTPRQIITDKQGGDT